MSMQHSSTLRRSLRKLIFAPMFFCLFSATGFTQFPVPGEPNSSSQIFEWADDLLDDASGADGTDSIDIVLQVLEKALAREPESAPLHMLMGRALIIKDCALGGNNCSTRAKGHLLKAAQLDPKLLRVQVLLAHDALNAGCLPCARPHLDRAFNIDRDNPFALEVGGRYFQLAGQRGPSEKNYLRSIERQPKPKKRFQAYTWLSQIYREVNDYKRAEWALRNAVESRPNSAWAHGNLGTFYIFALGDYENAIPEIRKALSIMDFGMARNGLALALYERWADAYFKKAGGKVLKQYFEEAVAASPDKPAVFFDSANYKGTGRAAIALFSTGQVSKSILKETWEGGRTPLLLAMRNENESLVRFFLERGANPNARDEQGLAAVHYAARHGNLNLLKTLVSRGGSIVAVEKGGGTVLTLAAFSSSTKSNSVKFAEIALKGGVAINHQDARGITALGYAAMTGKVDMVKYLLARGARGDVVSRYGDTPIGLAMQNDQPETFAILLKEKSGLDTPVHGMSLEQFAEKLGRTEFANRIRAAKGQKL